MEDALDHLIDAWQDDPSEANTVSLCKALAGSGQASAIRDLGSDASARHPQSVAVLVAVGRMYLSAALLADAQVVLVSAGKIAPKSAEVYRWLGEILLRRGDASRADKVLGRALALGKTDGATRFWHSRARSLVAVQQQRGERGVAEEVARASLATVPGSYDDPASGDSSLASLGDDESTVVQSMSLPDDPDALADLHGLDDPTVVQRAPPEEPAAPPTEPDSSTETTTPAVPAPPLEDVPLAAAAPATAMAAAAVPTPAPTPITPVAPPAASPPFPHARAIEAPPIPPPPPMAPLPSPPRPMASPRPAQSPPTVGRPGAPAAPAAPVLGSALPPVSRPPPAGPKNDPAAQAVVGPAAPAAAEPIAADTAVPDIAPAAAPPLAAPAAAAALAAPAAAPFAAPAAAPPVAFAATAPAVASAAALGSALPPVRARGPVGPLDVQPPTPSPAAFVPLPPAIANGAPTPQTPSYAPALGSGLPPIPSRPPPGVGAFGAGPSGYPSQQPVPMSAPAPGMDALAVAHVSVPPTPSYAPSRAPRSQPRRTGKVLTFTLLGILGVGGIVAWRITAMKAKRVADALVLVGETEHALAVGRPSDFGDAKASLGHAFELAPEDPRTALAWVRERVLRATWMEAGTTEIDVAITRAEQTGVAAAELTFAKACLQLLAGKNAEAIETLRQGGSTSPDGEAYTHWIRGLALENSGQPRATEEFQAASEQLAPARILATLRAVLTGDPRAKDIVTETKSKLGDRADTAALVALAWVMGPGETAPPEVESTRVRRADLPLALRFVPDALDAAEAAGKRSFAAGRAPLAKAKAAASTIPASVLIGRLAIATRDEKLAHDMADKTKTAIEPAGRSLSAHVALLDGRLDEAATAATTAPDGPALRAAIAYERLDAPGLAKETAGVKPSSGLGELLRGTEASPARIKSFDDPRNAFGECAAADAALDAGNIQLARDIIDSWGGAKNTEAHALRFARLLRYTDRASEAESTTRPYSEGKPTLRFAIERVLELVQSKKGDEAKTWLGKNSGALGDVLPWANAYVDASHGQREDADKTLAKRAAPADMAPLPVRLLAAYTYAALGDKKNGEPLNKRIAKSVPHHPDLVAVAKLLASGGVKSQEAPAKPKHGH